MLDLIFDFNKGVRIVNRVKRFFEIIESKVRFVRGFDRLIFRETTNSVSRITSNIAFRENFYRVYSRGEKRRNFRSQK